MKVFRYAQHAYNVDMCFSGFNISQRRRRKSIIGFQHRITKEESIKWFQSKVTYVDCIPGTETYTPLTHCLFSVHFVCLIGLVSWVLGRRWGGEKGRSLAVQMASIGIKVEQKNYAWLTHLTFTCVLQLCCFQSSLVPRPLGGD